MGQMSFFVITKQCGLYGRQTCTERDCGSWRKRHYLFRFEQASSLLAPIRVCVVGTAAARMRLLTLSSLLRASATRATRTYNDRALAESLANFLCSRVVVHAKVDLRRVTQQGLILAFRESLFELAGALKIKLAINAITPIFIHGIIDRVQMSQ
jgi:hypothetical protein